MENDLIPSRVIPKDKNIVLYDGDCGFCNFWVQWILKRDTKDIFRFASLQSALGQQFLKERGLPIASFDTLYLWQPGKAYFMKADAVFTVGKLLGGTYSFAGTVLLHFPTWIKNSVYDLVARNRKKIRRPQCLLPSPEQKKKFLS